MNNVSFCGFKSEFGASTEDDDADEGDGGEGESESDGEEGEEEMLGEPEYANVGSAAAQAAGILNSNPSSAIDHHQQPVINLHQDSFGQVNNQVFFFSREYITMNSKTKCMRALTKALGINTVVYSSFIMKFCRTKLVDKLRIGNVNDNLGSRCQNALPSETISGTQKLYFS